MDNLLMGFQHLFLGTATLLTTVGSLGTNAYKPQNTPLPSPVAISLPKNIVTRSGEYSHDGYTLKYTVHIPKDGGAVTGSFSGVCKGPITGKFDGGEGGRVEGLAKASCGVAFINYNLQANYTGKIYLKQGQIDLNWEGKIPYTSNKGSFTVNFEPVN